MREKAVLAFSGGLDTSILVRILTEDYKYDVVAVHVDIGEARDPAKLRDRAKKSGAVAVEIVDAKAELVRDFCWPALRANALYQGVYPLNSALSRPLIARHLVAAARKHGATVAAHGSTGKGNDQVRFDLSVRALGPDLKVVAPQRERHITRDFAMDYAKKHGIEVPVTVERPYSIDENLWGRSIEGGRLEEPDAEPPEDAFLWTRPVDKTPEKPAILRIGFREGVPVSLDGDELAPEVLVARVNEIAGEHGVGRIDLMEDRVVGIKSREVYEAPGAVALIAARKDLERFTCTGDANKLKARLDLRYAELVYEGFWYSPLREALDAFNAALSRSVEGTVTLKLHRGGLRVVGRDSKFGLYNKRMATYGKEDRWDHKAAEGFVNLLGLQLVEFRRVHPLR